MKLWKNAKIYSLNSNNDIYYNLVTNNGLVVDYNINEDKYKYDEVIDLKGNFLFPGFTDAHIHLIGYGRRINSINISHLNKKEDILKYLISINKKDNLFIEGYYDIGITNKELDLVSKDNLIILRHNDYHSFTVNSKVLDRVGLNDSNGIIYKENESKLINPIWSLYSIYDLLTYTNLAIKKLHEYGITSVHSDDLSYFNSYNETLEILNESSLKNPLRINTLIHYDIYEEYLKSYGSYKYLNDIQVKLFYDGTLSSKTALLSSNYKNSNNAGVRIHNNKEFINIIKKIRSNNHSVAIHTIGDLALEEVTNILIKYPTTNKMPDRIVHGSLAKLETIEKIATNNIVIDIQAKFKVSDYSLIKNIIDHDCLIYPFKEYHDLGVTINSSSDAPVEDPNPLIGIALLDDINRIDVIKSYTTSPCYTICSKDGIIDIGKNADFTIFTKDITKVSNEELLNTFVYATVVDELVVYLKRDGDY